MRFNKKVFFIILFSILSIGVLVTIISIKSINTYKPAFYIYSSYVDQQTKKDIDKKYTLKEYGDLNQFDYAIGNNKTIAGITSDYLIINLIKEGKLAPISLELKKVVAEKYNKKVEDINLLDYYNFSTLDQITKYNMGFDGWEDSIFNKTNELQKELRNKYPEYGEEYHFKFEDFIVPYFINDRVFAYDTNKILGRIYKQGECQEPIAINKDKTTKNILETIKNDSRKNIVVQWTKNEIENSIIGSEKDEKFNTFIDSTNYEKLVNDFNQILIEGTGASMSNNKVNIFEPDSDIILNNLISPSSRINIAVLYNGDALDAYYGNDNFKDVQDGDRVRIIRPKNAIRILDAFVVSSNTSKQERKELIDFFYQTLFDGMFDAEDEINESYYKKQGIMKIFDYVNYTLAAKGPYEYIKKNYFLEDDKIDKVALDIFDVPLKATPIAPIDKQAFSKLVSYFQKKLNG